MDLIDLLIDLKENNKKYFDKTEKYAKKIKTAAQKLLGQKTKVYLFGSIISKKFTPTSDIDVLVVGKEVLPEDRGFIRVRLKKSVGLTSPFEIHLTTSYLFKTWYKKFIKNNFVEI